MLPAGSVHSYPAQRKSEAAGQAAFAQATIDALIAP
jgi:hypothetical protein